MSRERSIYISRKLFACLLAMRRGSDEPIEAVAEHLLETAVQDKAPEIWAFYDKYEKEERELLTQLTQSPKC